MVQPPDHAARAGRIAVRTAEALAGALVAALLLGALLGQPIGPAFVETGSMQPTLAPGDGFVAVPPALSGDLGPGDVVTFRSRTDGGRLTTHRIVERTPDGFVTRGDANPFTDQQAGEPPVTRERIVAVALRVNGGVVSLGGLGAAVGAARGLVAGLAGTLGLAGGAGRLAPALAAAVAGAWLLDRVLAAGRRSARDRRRREDGFDADRLLALSVLAVVCVATLTTALAGGTTAVTFDSVAPGDDRSGGIPAGAERQVPVELSNRGLLPAVTVLSASDGATPSDRTARLGARSTAIVNVTVAAPVEPGSYERTVRHRRYLGVLPAGLVLTVHDTHPWLAVLATDAVLVAVLVPVGRLLVGRGRLRSRDRSIPAGVALRRTLGRLYR